MPEAEAPAANVAETLSRYYGELLASTHARKKLAATWQGTAAEEEKLANVVTGALRAACAIVDDSAVFAMLRQQNPAEARRVAAFARKNRDTLIALVLQQMPQPRPEPELTPEPEPPSFGMGM
ncbi:MAG: hypothetical protein LGL72_12890 [Acidibrevibacterium sp.]|uniref:hypothetical protein n=1 Tax=Acidibrevibacterium fodinaquatile TaxID=1969806 RepID=UPI0023A8D85C|nr:hypothetical protein [Acidibrevibacterium fodinaquatile]MCA7120276.1 hypothetical protein [Acidibrevibacterium fodinaquatile]